MRTTIDKILQAANGRIHQWAVVEVKDIEFSEEVVAACRANYCGNYNKSWMCPPHVGTLEELKSRYTAYRYAFVFTTRHEVEDSFDIEGMFAARLVHDEVEDLIRPCLPENAPVLGAGRVQRMQEMRLSRTLPFSRKGKIFCGSVRNQRGIPCQNRKNQLY